jgi:hypothetical protein
MSTIHRRRTTTLTPERSIAGLTDFGPGRSRLFGNSADEYLEVQSTWPFAGRRYRRLGGVWERLHYDWSNPDRVILATTDSNVWGGASGHTHTFVGRPDGKTDIDVVVGKNPRVGYLALCLGRSVRAS